MRVSAHLYDPAADRRAVIHDATDWSETRLALLCWTEGNFGCDCNRRMFMDRARGVEAEYPETTDDGPDPYPCGEEVVLVRLVDTATGEELVL